MKKLIIKTELICPFNQCRTFYGEDKDGNLIYREMGIGCKTCSYVWERDSHVIERPIINGNSKECKEYELLHTPIEV